MCAGSIGRELHLRIEPFEDEFGRRLGAVVDERVRLAAQPASLDRVLRSMVFENDSAADLYFDTINTDTPLQTSLQGALARAGCVSQQPPAPCAAHSGRSVGNNAWVKGSVVSRLSYPQYFYYDDGPTPRAPTQQEFFAQRTPFNIEWFDGVRHGLVWVTRLQDALPMPGATVLLMRVELGAAATAVARVMTDARGLAHLDYSQLPRNAASSAHYLEVRHGAERGWMVMFLMNPAAPPGDAAAVPVGKLTITAAAKPLFSVTVRSQVAASAMDVKVAAVARFEVQRRRAWSDRGHTGQNHSTHSLRV